MANTIRQLIMTNLIARMATILTTNGYETNAGSNVFEWRDAAFTENELPGMVIRDRDCTVERDNYSHDKALNIEIGIKGSSAANVRKVIGDVYKAIGTDITWGGYAYDTQPEGEDIDVENADIAVAECALRITIFYKTVSWDAYTRLS